jgi:hypothetical protein
MSWDSRSVPRERLDTTAAAAREAIDGRHCRLEPIDPERHAAALFEANALDTTGGMWTYLPYGPFAPPASIAPGWKRPVSDRIRSSSPSSIVPRECCRRCELPQHRSRRRLDRGGSPPSRRLQRTIAATEAMYLMMKLAFELGYRRYEWKCNALNAPSRAAAMRLGLSFEGIFRQAWVVKGRNRDTAWYAAIDAEWPDLERAFQRWLDPANFDAAGRQRESLSSLTGPILKSRC